MTNTAKHHDSITGNDVFTTGQVAKICKVTIRTVIKWFETGKLGGYRIPQSKDRRIPRDELIAFMREHGLPIDSRLLLRSRLVLIVDPNPTRRRAMAEALLEIEGAEVHTAATGYEAGFLTARLEPAVLVLDENLPDADAATVIDTLAADPRFSTRMRVVLMTEGCGSQHAPRKNGTVRVLCKPFDRKVFVAETRACLER